MSFTDCSNLALMELLGIKKNRIDKEFSRKTEYWIVFNILFVEKWARYGLASSKDVRQRVWLDCFSRGNTNRIQLV